MTLSPRRQLQDTVSMLPSKMIKCFQQFQFKGIQPERWTKPFDNVSCSFAD